MQWKLAYNVNTIHILHFFFISTPTVQRPAARNTRGKFVFQRPDLHVSLNLEQIMHISCDGVENSGAVLLCTYTMPFATTKLSLIRRIQFNYL